LPNAVALCADQLGTPAAATVSSISSARWPHHRNTPDGNAETAAPEVSQLHFVVVPVGRQDPDPYYIHPATDSVETPAAKRSARSDPNGIFHAGIATSVPQT
jgi:hypothetical protein